MTDAVLLAGGRGTRLAEVASGLPKPMVPVAGRPFIEHVLDWLVTQGVDRLVLSVSYRAEVLQRHFGARYRDVPVAYSVEAEPLGTGGAVRQCFAQLGLERAVVVNADTLFPIDLAEFMRAHAQGASDVTMALRFMPDASRYGSVHRDADGYVVGFAEKRGGTSGLINGGIYALERRALERFDLPERFSLERDCLERHVTELRPYGFVSDAYFIDIGIPEDLERARRDLAAQ